MASIVFVRKRNMKRGASHGVYAAYLESTDGRYLGDVGPAFLSGPKRDPERPKPSIGWWAHPAGQRERRPLLWPSREAAAAAMT